MITTEQPWQKFDREHIWHPYTSLSHPLPTYPIESASGTRLKLCDGAELIDGMSSWWAAIHGYNHPVINKAIEEQTAKMTHFMFGGISHQPATTLAQKLLELAPKSLDNVFFSDSGSVAVEVAMKMALQYCHTTGKQQGSKFLTVRGGYHGDTFLAMSVCDPVAGMHSIFKDTLAQNYFADKPACSFTANWKPHYIDSFKQLINIHHNELAAVILEPIVQGAGGLNFYHPEYLRQIRELCDQYDVLLILDEIATGFGRTGKMFACEHADISPDIMCVGKALTGGNISLAATMSTKCVADGICANENLFMHGPTFMANPLACAIANASLEILCNSPWQENIARIEHALQAGLEPCRNSPLVADVRVLGAIGVVELKQDVDQEAIQAEFVKRGVWVRPFGKLVYLMPPFIIDDNDLQQLISAVVEICSECS